MEGAKIKQGEGSNRKDNWIRKFVLNSRVMLISYFYDT